LAGTSSSASHHIAAVEAAAPTPRQARPPSTASDFLLPGNLERVIDLARYLTVKGVFCPTILPLFQGWR